MLEHIEDQIQSLEQEKDKIYDQIQDLNDRTYDINAELENLYRERQGYWNKETDDLNREYERSV